MLCGGVLNSILARALGGKSLSLKEIEFLLSLERPDQLDRLFLAADTLRKRFVGERVCIHGILEFSNHCKNHCQYCGLRCQNKKLNRYRIPVEEIVRVAGTIHRFGYKMIVLQSGEDLWYDRKKLLEIVKGIREKCQTLIFLSVGERDFKTYQDLYRAGAKGVLFRFETSDKRLFQKLHPKKSKAKRFEHLDFFRKIGYLVASGPLIGLPAQTLKSLAKDILLMKKLRVTMASMGPFLPHPETPLKDAKPGSLEMTLRMIAVTRLVYPQVRIPITTALEVIGGNEGRELGLKAGGNAFMLDLTPEEYRKSYEIYPGKTTLKIHQHSKEALKNLLKIIEKAGRKPCLGWGRDFVLTPQKFLKTTCK
jgi:biotin synthase